MIFVEARIPTQSHITILTKVPGVTTASLPSANPARLAQILLGCAWWKKRHLMPLRPTYMQWRN